MAEIPEPTDDFWYLDQSDVLSDETEGEIFFANQRLYDACGAEIVVVAVDSTDGMAIDDYAYSLFNDWQIGGNTYRGMLLLMAIEDDNYYAMPGTALSMYFDSATLGNMLEKHLEPDFAKKDYDAGAKAFFEAVYEKVVDDFNLNLSITDARADYNAFIREYEAEQVVQSPDSMPVMVERRDDSSRVSLGLIIVLFCLLIIVTRRFRRNRRVYSAPHVHVQPARRSSFGSFASGVMLGRMMNRNRPVHRGPVGGMPPMGGPGHMGSRPRTGSSGTGMSGGFRSSSRPTGGFGGAGRGTGSFGSSSRSGFGGASRSGGASRGPSTRGGGAGRFSR